MASASNSTTSDLILKAVKNSPSYKNIDTKAKNAIIKDVKTVLDHGGKNWKTNISPFKWPNMGAKNIKQIVLKSDAETVKKIIDDIGTDSDFDPSQKQSGTAKPQIKIVIDGQPIFIQSTGSALEGVASKIGPGKMTAMQELGSAWVFKRAIKDNKEFKKWEDIKKDKETYDEIKSIWKQIANEDSVPDEWIQNFYKQNAKLLGEVGHKKYTIFTRGKTKNYTANWYNDSDTFMEWVTEKVKSEFKIAKKDNWNPADVWLIRDEQKHRDRIEEALKTPVKKKNRGIVEANLAQFNAIFRDMWKNHDVWGISLKKVSGATADWKPVNTSEAFFKKLEATEMEFKSARCRLDEEVKKGVRTLGTQESQLFIEDKDSNKEFNITIKSTKGSGFDNLKYEPTEKGKSAARMGKATSAFVDDLIEVYLTGSQWQRRWQQYPDTATKFDTPVYKREYKKKIQILIDNDVQIGRTKNDTLDADEAIENIKTAFGTQPHVANAKLMQITWLANFYGQSSSPEKRNKMATDMIFLAEKAGRRYGPYGKLY